MGRQLALALVLAAFATPARGQTRRHFPARGGVRLTFREHAGGSGGKGTVSLRTRGLPAGTAVEFSVTLDGGEIDASWTRGLVGKDGRLTIELGPFGKPLLPGAYRLLLKVNPDQQDASLDRVFEKWKRRPVERSYLWRYRADEEKAERERFRRKLMEHSRSMLGVLSRVLEAGRGYRGGRKFFSGGKFQPQVFSPWAKQATEPLFAARQAVSRLADANLAPYHPRVCRGDLPNLFLMIRIAVIDYTIYPIHVREKLSAPSRLQPLKDVMMKPTRKQAIARARLLARQIAKKLDPGQQRPLLAGLFPPEERLPKGFRLAELTGELAGLISSNPGATTDVTESVMRKVARRLGIKQPASDLQEFGLLALAARKPGGSGSRPVVLYLFRFKQETYGLLLQEQLAQRKQDGKFRGQLLVRQDIVAVITSEDRPAQRAAVRQLVKHLTTKQRFRQYQEQSR